VNEKRYKMDICFHTIELPPFHDVLILSKKCPHGLKGISECIGLLAPDGYEYIEMNEMTVGHCREQKASEEAAVGEDKGRAS